MGTTNVAAEVLDPAYAKHAFSTGVAVDDMRSSTPATFSSPETKI